MGAEVAPSAPGSEAVARETSERELREGADREPQRHPESAAHPRTRPASWIGLGSLAAAAIVSLPYAWLPPGPGLDLSWTFGLSLALQKHLQWGPQLVFTFGPYGFVNHLFYHSFGTWLVALLIALALHAALFLAIAAYLWEIGARAWTHLLVAAGFLLPVLPYLTPEYDCLLAVMTLLITAAITSSTRRSLVPVVSAGVLLGLLVNIKGTGIAAALGLTAAYTIVVLAQKAPLRALPIFVAAPMSFLALWLLAGQSPASLPSYARGSYEVISGYSAAMSVLHEFGAQHIDLQVLFGLLVVTSSAVVAGWALVRKQGRVAATFLLVSPVLLLGFKEGFVRLDDHQLDFYSLVVVIGLLVLAGVLGQRTPLTGRALLALQPAAAVAVSALLLAGPGFAVGAVGRPPVWPESNLSDRLATYSSAERMITDPAYRSGLSERFRARVRSAYPLAPATVAVLSKGTVDVIPWDIEIVYAYGFRWTPRPVLQSYGAYTPYLDQLDAAHIRGPDAADHVLLAYRAIDQRYLPYDEPAMLRALMAAYEVDRLDGDFLVLSRRTHVLDFRLRPMGQVTRHLGERIPVPFSSGRVFASVGVPYSVRGRLDELLYQPAELRVRFQLTDGRDTAWYRFEPGQARDGVALDTYVGDVEELRLYLQGELPHPIRAFQIVSDDPTDYAGDVRVTFSMT